TRNSLTISSCSESLMPAPAQKRGARFPESHCRRIAYRGMAFDNVEIFLTIAREGQAKSACAGPHRRLRSTAASLRRRIGRVALDDAGHQTPVFRGVGGPIQRNPPPARLTPFNSTA